MKRYRWSYAKWSLNMRELSQRIRSNPFGDESVEGFIIDRTRDDYIEARYIERIEYVDKIIDPFGNETEFERVVYNQCEFRATSSFPGLELVNAPRKTQRLVSRLLEINNFSLIIEPFSIEVLDWASQLQNLADITVTVDSMQIGSLELAPKTYAKVVIKGDKDVREAGKKFTIGKHHEVEKVQLRIQGGFQGTVILENSGAAKVDVTHNDDFVTILRKGLSTLR